MNEDGTYSVFTRTKKYQIEKNGDIEMKDRIEWVDECTFKLHPIKIKDESGVIGNDVLIFKFIKTFDHAYLVRVTIENNKELVLEFKVYEFGYLNYDK